MIIRKLLLVGILSLTAGCFSPGMKSTDDPVGLKYEGLGSAYVAFGPEIIGESDTRFIRGGLLGRATRPGEWVSLDVWPLFGVGVGLAGARIQLLPFEVGAGTLWYEPRPRVKAKKPPESAELPSEPDTRPVEPDSDDTEAEPEKY